MRILRVAQRLYPDEKGGGAYHAHAMSRDQAAMGHDVTVLTVGDGPPREHRDGYTVVRKRSLVAPLGNELAPGAALFLRRAGPSFDVVHAHSHLYFLSNLAALHGCLSGTPLAITNHGLYSQTAPERLFEAYLGTIGRWTFDRADVVFCYTETDEERLRDLGVASPVRVVPNGIDTERFSPGGPTSDQVAHDGPVVLFVGRLVEGKRPDVALEAVARLDDLDAALYVCGEGPLRPSLAAQAGPRTTFLGSVPYDEMPAVYRAADALVLTSRAEGVPRTIMEALSSGVPVVSSDLPQVRSAFGDAIAYAPTGDAEAFADRLREALAAEATPDLDPRFAWDRTVRETTDALAAVVDGEL